MDTRSSVAVAALVILAAACGGETEQMFLGAPLSSNRAYVVFSPGVRDPYQILDPERLEPARRGPQTGSLLDPLVLADGSLIFGNSDEIERFDPASGLSVVGADLCSNEGELLVGVAVHPDRQAMVHACRRVFEDQVFIFEVTRARSTCPVGQEFIAAGSKDALLCSRQLIAGDGAMHALDFEEGTITAVRSRADGGFSIVIRNGEREVLHEVSSSGAVVVTGDYPALQDTDEFPVALRGTVRPRLAVLLTDGVLYQLAQHRDARGRFELFRMRPGDTEVVSLPLMVPAFTQYIWLATGS